jgi:hypothetical protein
MRQVPMMELDANLCHLEKLAPDMPRVCLLIALPKLNIEVVAVPQWVPLVLKSSSFDLLDEIMAVEMQGRVFRKLNE